MVHLVLWRPGVCISEACMAGGLAWQGVCMAGGMHGRGTCVAGGVRARRDGHCSGRYVSFWNAFLLLVFNASVFSRHPLWSVMFFVTIRTPSVRGLCSADSSSNGFQE